LGQLCLRDCTFILQPRVWTTRRGIHFDDPEPVALQLFYTYATSLKDPDRLQSRDSF
jgi:hypothetical protein